MLDGQIQDKCPVDILAADLIVFHELRCTLRPAVI